MSLIKSSRWVQVLILACSLFLIPTLAVAVVHPLATEGPVALSQGQKALSTAPVFDSGSVDVYTLRSQAEDMVGEAPRFADPQPTRITPETHGSWDQLDNGYSLWQLRVRAPGALSLNFGMTDFELPKNSRLMVYPQDYRGLDDLRGVRVFSEADNRDHRELWTPVVVSDDVVLELLVPTASRDQVSLELTSINRGFLFLGDEADKQGSCNIDVVCPEGDDWWNEINSVGVYTISGTWYCTGAVINNTSEDQTPYFLTANHCDVNTSNDQAVVIYWNFQSVNCGDLSGGSLNQYSSGVTYLASGSASDFCLVEINDPLSPDWGVTFSGWDRSGDDMDEAIAIHHPSTDEKAISFEYDPTTTTSYLQNSVPGNGTHIRITDWDLGTTEPGSSGSPLYSPEHRIVGQLHGGYAACGNNSSDWYGKLSYSWSSLAQWLDPGNTGQITLDTLNPYATGMLVSSGAFNAEGNSGGPFSPSSATYTVTNQGTYAIDYSVTLDVNWLTVTSGASGALNPGQSAEVSVALNAQANGLGNGSYVGNITITNVTDGSGDATRLVNLTVGVPEMVYSVNMDTDPNWATQGDWAWGEPTGDGGQYGNADPTSGHTGTHVMGYNLGGDYGNNLAETHVTSLAFDCSDLVSTSLKFWRYLNVEQPAYDHASIYVSTNGANFTQIWTNSSVIEDNAWNQVEYDISGLADGQETVYIRWTMGTTDGSWQYSGWNIDDVEIWGVDTTSGPSSVGEGPMHVMRLGNYPNPFNPLTRVQFTLAQAGPAALNVYDVQGRLVRSLVNEDLSAGDHSYVWDGADNSGRKVGSGVYFARLVSGRQVIDHKMVLLK
jgi:lysyl endopeptidase